MLTPTHRNQRGVLLCRNLEDLFSRASHAQLNVDEIGTPKMSALKLARPRFGLVVCVVGECGEARLVEDEHCSSGAVGLAEECQH